MRPFFSTALRIVKSISGVWATKSKAIEVALEDNRLGAVHPRRRFSLGTRPVIRWIKGDGLDDEVTRAAIGQATRLFGTAVDYCLCTNGIGAARVRSILEWAAAPVEWWPLSPGDNTPLANILLRAGCPLDRFGYWWKWFPERVRPAGPEWVMDGDMVITGKPSWFGQWAAGKDRCRVSQDDRWPLEGLYSRYVDMVDESYRLYSGLISLPPGMRYMPYFCQVMSERPLLHPHDGCKDMCEQGIVAAALQRLKPEIIPLCEFPFGRAFDDALDFGLRGDQGSAWGWHFGYAFRMVNPHFRRLCENGTILSLAEPPGTVERFAWLGNTGQWGVPGWSTTDAAAETILRHACLFKGRPVLELGTSRGRITAILASAGCHVTTLDRHDRGASQNLAGLGVSVVVSEAGSFLDHAREKYDLIVVDLHGNSDADWGRIGPRILRCLAHGGTLILSNTTLWRMPEWKDQTGVRTFVESLPGQWHAEHHPDVLPGISILTAPS